LVSKIIFLYKELKNFNNLINSFTTGKVLNYRNQARGGYGYRSTGHNINGPNINELQINCSIDQRKPVDV
jgi:hypothetical protein